MAEAAPKSPAKAPESVKPDDLESLDGIQEIIKHLKKKDWSAMVGAIMAMWTEHFGTDEEKAKLRKERKEAKEKEAKEKTKGDLKELKGQVEEGKEKEPKKEEKPELVKNPELGDGREYVVIGDSAANGMHLSYASGKRPTFIGKDGMTTGRVLERLKEERSKLKGKKKAMIYCAGNNILGSSTKTLVDHMIAMARICKDAEIPEIIVSSQFPPIPAYRTKIGPEKFATLKTKNEALRKALIQAHEEGRFPSGTRVVDLTTPFSDEKGEMKAEFVDPKATDYLHPWVAYKPALDYMQKEESSKVA